MNIIRPLIHLILVGIVTLFMTKKIWFNCDLTLITFSISNIICWYLAGWLKAIICSLPALRIDPKNKCVFITGCDSGFGHTTALQLNELGFKVFAGCLFPEESGAKNLIKSCKYSNNLMIIKIDVTKDEDIANSLAIVKNNIKENEVLHGLVNNAGVMKPCEFEWDTYDNFGQTMDVNIIGMAKVTRKFLPLIRRARGRIVNITSLSGRFTCPFGTAYTTSKHAAVGLSKNLSGELDKFGVSVTSIEPAWHTTNMTMASTLRNVYQKAWLNTDDHIKEDFGQEYFDKGLKAFKVLDLIDSLPNIAGLSDKKSSRVADTVVLALTHYEPDQRYIAAPGIQQLPIRICEFLPDEIYSIGYGIMYWICSLNRPYPKKKVY